MKTHYGLIQMIHPTQITVGYNEVAIKMQELYAYHKNDTLDKYLKSKNIPCVLGIDNIIYITDHHHMGLALSVLANEWEKNQHKKEKSDNPYSHCWFEIIHDFSSSNLSQEELFKTLSSLSLLHAYDENGNRTDNKIPKCLSQLKNDPYRSLAGIVRKSGGYNKCNVPFTEFTWADFFRNNITKKELENNFKETVIKAIALALSEQANKLPGWKGIEMLNEFNPDLINKIQIFTNQKAN